MWLSYRFRGIRVVDKTIDNNTREDRRDRATTKHYYEFNVENVYLPTNKIIEYVAELENIDVLCKIEEYLLLFWAKGLKTKTVQSCWR